MTFKTQPIALQISTIIALPVIATAGFIGQFLSLSKCMKINLVGGWLMGCLLVSLDILNKNDFGVREIFARIKTTILGKF